MTESNDNLHRLVPLYKNLKQKNESLINNGVTDYCLISSLLKPNDEVRLHSRFIFSMVNPNGLHYCKTLFLQEFLSFLPKDLQGFINLDKAVVLKEQGNIDLLIHDENNFLIVENKLNAVDQPYQISRYVQYIQEKYFKGDKDIADNLAVVYLSKFKLKPSEESNSLMGFDLSNGWLNWQGISNRPNELKTLNLIADSKIRYFHYSYFPLLEAWVHKCQTFDSVPEEVKNAFREYGLILERIKPGNRWRKILQIDHFTLAQEQDDEQLLYEVMVQARKRLSHYVAAKLYNSLIEIFGEDVVSNHGPFHPMTEKNIRLWIEKKRSTKNIGFICSESEDSKIGFVMAVERSYFGHFNEDAGITDPDKSTIVGGTSNNRELNCIIEKNNQKLLLEENDGVFAFIEKIVQKKDDLNLI